MSEIAVPTLATERLVLRPFRQEDADDYAELCADPEVMRFLGDRRALGRDEAWRQMAMLAGHWQLRGFGMWAVVERSSGTFLGRVGLHYPDGWPDREVAWALARRHWGRGFACEAARAALAHAFGTLGWPRAISLIDPANHRSIRLAERLGETLEGAIEMRGVALSVYAIERAAWESAGRPR